MSLSNWYAKWFKRRPGHVYKVTTWDPTMTDASYRFFRKEVGYVGMTQRRDPKRRWREHLLGTLDRPPAPWSDLVVDHIGWHGFETVYSSRAVTGVWLRQVEWFYIRLYRPRYNYQHNLRNRKRVTKYDAAAQREIRDLVRSEHGSGWF